jgi:hypothetical protein
MILKTQKLIKGADMEDRCMLFSDALALWNGSETKAYLEVKYPGWAARFIKPVCTTYTGTIYKDKPPGNSPENARGLDLYGFADLEYAMCLNCALSSVFHTSTPVESSARGRPRRCGAS